MHTYHEIMTIYVYMHIHDVIDDVTMPQSRSNFELYISPWIFELERRSKNQNVGNTYGYLSGIFSFNFWYINHSFNSTSDMKRLSQIMSKKFCHGDDVIDDVTGWPQSFPLYSCLGEVGSGRQLQGQCLVNKGKHHNCLSRLYIPKDDLNE